MKFWHLSPTSKIKLPIVPVSKLVNREVARIDMPSSYMPIAINALAWSIRIDPSGLVDSSMNRLPQSLHLKRWVPAAVLPDFLRLSCEHGIAIILLCLLLGFR